MMLRYLTLTLFFAFASIALAGKPNIIFIMVDDLGKDWISCYGADNIQTPHIDALAKGGMKFHNAWSMPQCTPTRATLPTFAELGGALLPKGITLDGKSFAPLLLGKANDSPRDWILAMGHGAARLDAQGVRGRTDYMDRVLRDKRYKVWLDKGPKISRLYDLKTDPMEKDDLIKSHRLAHVATLNKFQEIADSQPKIDARPQCRSRKANPWDRKLKEALNPKLENRKNTKEKNGNN